MASFRVLLEHSASWCKGRGLTFRKGIPVTVPDGPVLDAIRASGLFAITELKSPVPKEPVLPVPPPKAKEPEPSAEPEPEPEDEPEAESEEDPKPKRFRKGKKKS